MIKPSRGRVVLFTPHKEDQVAHGGEALAAIIAHVHSDTVLNLSVFDAFGRLHPRPSVPLLQEGDGKPVDGGYAEWMPFQRGQAAKTEHLEKQLAASLGSAGSLVGASINEASDRPAGGGISFSAALICLKDGERVARQGWNGKGMFVYLVPAASYPAQTGAAKAHFGEGSLVPYNAYLALKGVDETVSTWVPSVNDCLAEDWMVLE